MRLPLVGESRTRAHEVDHRNAPPILLVDGMFHEERIAPSCGLGALGGYLREQGFDVKLFSPNNHRLDEAQCADWIIEHARPILGISLLTPLVIPPVLKLIRELVARGCDAFIMVGGHGASLAYEQLLRDEPAIDCVVIGDGEQTCEELVERIAAGADWTSTLGIARRDADGTPVFNGPRKTIRLDDYPVMAIDLLEDVVALFGPTARMSVYSSRGCYADCTYCSVKAFTKLQGVKPYRMRSIEKIVDEIELIYRRLGARNFVMEDDNFLVPGAGGIKRAKEFKEALQARGINIRLWLQTRPECITLEGLSHLKDAGVDDVFIGTESFDQASLDLYHRNNTVEETLQALDVFEQLGFSCDVEAERRVRIGSMIFHPYVTLAQLRPQTEYFRRYRIPPKKLIKRLHPAGDVVLSRRLEAEGLLGEDGEYRFLNREVSDVFHTMRAFRREFIEIREQIRIAEKKYKLHVELGPSPAELRDARRMIDAAFLDLFETLCDEGHRGPERIKELYEHACRQLRLRLGVIELRQHVSQELEKLSGHNLNM
jgi:hypothetical protein